jgi:uncharacterized protein
VTSLADRIRGVVGGQPRGDRTAPAADAGPGPASGARLAERLGGEWRDGCLVVERRWTASDAHGRERIGALAERLRGVSAEAALLIGDPVGAPFVFFDLETTGLSGGAGTHAFLVGCARFAGDEFVTRQFVLGRFEDERGLLDGVANELATAGALVSFNGKSFDGPVLETRYLFHRLAWIGGGLPHIDALHPARLFWKPAPSRGAEAVGMRGGGEWEGQSSCSLASLERHLLGHARAADVPGFEIPSRYFRFIRTGDPDPLVAVLEHNRLDLLSLAALTVRLLHLLRAGPSAAGTAREALALGRVYWRAGDAGRAEQAFRRAADSSREPDITVEAVRSLAVALRRMRRFDEAAACWRRLVETPCCSDRTAREAAEALAIHHEHRVRDLAAARTFALRSLEGAGEDRQAKWAEAVRHRLARIERKMRPAVSAPPLFPSSLWPLPLSSGSPTSARRTSS